MSVNSDPFGDDDDHEVSPRPTNTESENMDDDVLDDSEVEAGDDDDQHDDDGSASDGSVAASPVAKSEEKKKKRKLGEGKKSKKDKKASKYRLLDEQAEVSGSEASNDESEDEEDDNNYVIDGFVVQDDGDDLSDSSDVKGKQRKPKKELRHLKKKKKMDTLDEEDLLLIAENTKKALGHQTLDTIGNDNVIEPERGDNSDDEMGNFIDHDGDGDSSEGDFDAADHRHAAPHKSKTRYIASGSHINDGPTKDQLRQYAMLFGGLGSEDEDEDEFYGAEAEAKPNVARTPYEHMQLVQGFLLDIDKKIQETDRPERFVRYLKDSDVTEEQRAQEASWMMSQFENYAGKSLLRRACDKVGFHNAIMNVLRYIQNDNFEIPFIWEYKRDYLHADMQREHLWIVLLLDIKWSQLCYEKAIVDKLSYDMEVKMSLLEEEGVDSRHIFPVDKYRQILQATDDEVTIRDIAKYLRMVASSFTAKEMNRLMKQAQQRERLGKVQEERDDEEDGETQPAAPTRTAGDEDEEEGGDVYADDADHAAGQSSWSRTASSRYARFKKLSQVNAFIAMFCAPVHEIGFAIQNEFIVDHPPTPNMTFAEAAEQLVDGQHVKSARGLLEGAKIVLATELALEPSLRSKFRSIFQSGGTISTEPTDAGKFTITPFSMYFGIHLIARKPISTFYSRDGLCLFMKMLEAEKAGLIKIVIRPPEYDGKTSDKFMLQMTSKMMPSASMDLSPYRQSWDCFRLNVIEHTLEKLLLPSLAAEIKGQLIRYGKEAVIEEAAAAFETMLRTGPFIPKDDDYRDYLKRLLTATPERPHVKSIAAFYFTSDSRTALYMVSIDAEGNVTDRASVPSEVRNERDEKVKTFLYKNQPELIVLNSSGGQGTRSLSLKLEKDIILEINNIIQMEMNTRYQEGYYDTHPYEVLPDYRPHVIIVDDTLANNFRASPRAKILLPDMSPEFYAPTCLARFAQEPLAEYANLWHSVDSNALFGYEITFLSLHPQQKMVESSKAKFIRRLEFKLVDAIADAGLEINRTLRNRHLTNMLAFLPGLGLSKVDALKRKINEPIHSKKNVVEFSIIGGEVVTRNVGGFFRIHTPATTQNKDWHPLDNTRIHPDCYLKNEFVHKMCADALEVKIDPSTETEVITKLMHEVRREFERLCQNNPLVLDYWKDGPVDIFDTTTLNSGIVLTVVDNKLRDMLSTLKMEEFEMSLRGAELGERGKQLEQIKQELRFPWLDMRWPMSTMDANALFYTLCGESEHTLYVGRTLGFTVVLVKETIVVIRAENGLRGIITKRDVLDEDYVPYEFNIGTALPVGYEGIGVVIGLDRAKIEVHLSIKPRLVTKSETWWMRNREESPFAAHYWESMQKDPRHLFDSYFKIEDALDLLDSLDIEKQAPQELAAFNSNTGTSRATAAVSTVPSVTYTRSFVHPLFANVDYLGAERKLREGGNGAGAVLFRPSTKGADYLAITWAFQADSYKHFVVHERGKRPGDLGIGRALYIQEPDVENEQFSDLDEIAARYIEKLNDFVTLMTNHPKFHRGSVQEVEQDLRRLLAENPNRIPYFFRFEPTKPGCFTFTWLVPQRDGNPLVKKFRIDVRFQGYQIAIPGQQNYLSSPDALIIWFKKLQEQRPAAPSRSAPVPNTAQFGQYGNSNPPPRRSRFH